MYARVIVDHGFEGLHPRANYLEERSAVSGSKRCWCRLVNLLCASRPIMVTIRLLP